MFRPQSRQLKKQLQSQDSKLGSAEKDNQSGCSGAKSMRQRVSERAQEMNLQSASSLGSLGHNCENEMLHSLIDANLDLIEKHGALY